MDLGCNHIRIIQWWYCLTSLVISRSSISFSSTTAEKEAKHRAKGKEVALECAWKYSFALKEGQRGWRKSWSPAIISSAIWYSYISFCRICIIFSSPDEASSQHTHTASIEGVRNKSYMRLTRPAGCCWPGIPMGSCNWTCTADLAGSWWWWVGLVCQCSQKHCQSEPGTGSRRHWALEP